ncbi:MAG: glutaredoxin family protein [Candidatus Paceibacteria bacterium]
MQNVTIYTTPNCSFCKTAKAFFKEHDIAYTEHNVADDREKAQEMIAVSGQMGVPVIVIGKEVVIGFNEPRLRELLDVA